MKKHPFHLVHVVSACCGTSGWAGGGQETGGASLPADARCRARQGACAHASAASQARLAGQPGAEGWPSR